MRISSHLWSCLAILSLSWLTHCSNFTPWATPERGELQILALELSDFYLDFHGTMVHTFLVKEGMGKPRRITIHAGPGRFTFSESGRWAKEKSIVRGSPEALWFAAALEADSTRWQGHAGLNARVLIRMLRGQPNASYSQFRPVWSEEVLASTRRR